MKVLMSCGGTGGHIYPAIAIAETIKKMDPDAEISFIGGTEGLEKDIITKNGYPFYETKVCGYKRSFSVKNLLSNLKASYYAMKSPHEAKRIIKKLNPDIVIGTGGYACWPALKAASKLHIHTAVHESNVTPGLAVKMLQKHLDKIYVNFEETLTDFEKSGHAVRVGIPLRKEFETMDYEKAREQLQLKPGQKLILSFGGSGGAEYLNEGILKMMDCYDRFHPEIYHVHAAGKRAGLYESLKKGFDDQKLNDLENVKLVPYIDEMPLYMAAADLIICRAGAMTISELSMAGKSCILVPSPYVAGQHQYKNALALKEKGAAEIIYVKDERTFTGEMFSQVVDDLMNHEEKRNEMAKAIRQFALPEANALIGQEIFNLIHKGM